MRRALVWIAGVLPRAVRSMTVDKDPKVKHFWFSWSAVRAGYCNENTCLIDGVEMPYTCCSSSADHGTALTDLLYLGQGTIKTIKPTRVYWGAS